MPFRPSQSSDETWSSKDELHSMNIVRWWQDQDSERRADAIVRRASAMRVINGMICVAVSEPVVAVDVNDESVHVGFVEAAGDKSGGFAMGKDAIEGRRYRYENIAQAKDYARAFANATNRDLYINCAIDQDDGSSSGLAQEGEQLWSSADSLYSLIKNAYPVSEETEQVRSSMSSALDACPKRHATGLLADATQDLIWYLEDALQRGDIPDPKLAARLRLMLPWVQMDVDAWKHRPGSPDDWSYDAVPEPASWSIEQLLSNLAMRKVAMALQTETSKFEVLHQQGFLLFRYSPSEGPYSYQDHIIATSRDLVVHQAFGAFGRPMPAVVDARFAMFLEANRTLLEERLILASVSFA
jgi:hypothetical protein